MKLFVILSREWNTNVFEKNTMLLKQDARRHAERQLKQQHRRLKARNEQVSKHQHVSEVAEVHHEVLEFYFDVDGVAQRPQHQREQQVGPEEERLQTRPEGQQEGEEDEQQSAGEVALQLARVALLEVALGVGQAGLSM